MSDWLIRLTLYLDPLTSPVGPLLFRQFMHCLTKGLCVNPNFTLAESHTHCGHFKMLVMILCCFYKEHNLKMSSV